MKIFLFLLAALLLATSDWVNAENKYSDWDVIHRPLFDLELGLGATKWDDKANGYWWQERLPTTTQDVSAGFLVGVSWPVTEKIRLGVGYRHLGKVETQATATSDANYEAWTHGEEPLRTDLLGEYETTGYVHGVYLLGDYRPVEALSLRLGGWAHRAEQDVRVTWYHMAGRWSDRDYSPIRGEVRHDSTAELGVIYGVGWNIDETTQLNLDVLKVKAYGPLQPWYNGRSPVSLTLTKRF